MEVVDEPRAAADRHTHSLELLHFAFRNVVREPDVILARRGLHRAHHRILHFVGRAEEVAMLELLDILGITRQALHRPLRELISQKLIEVRPMPTNRRYFTLSLTQAGRKFESMITGMQRTLLAHAEAEVGRAAMDGWRDVMAKLAEGGPPPRTDPLGSDLPMDDASGGGRSTAANAVPPSLSQLEPG